MAYAPPPPGAIPDYVGEDWYLGAGSAGGKFGGTADGSDFQWNFTDPNSIGSYTVDGQQHQGEVGVFQGFTPYVPDWAGTDPGGAGFADAQTFWQNISGLDADNRAWQIAQWQSDYAAGQNTLSDRDAALEELRRTTGNVTESYASWQNNPNRDHVLDELRLRSDSAFEQTSDVEKAAFQNLIAQNVAKQKASLGAAAGGRGVGDSGLALGHAATLGGVAAGQNQQLAAQIASSNEDARQRALRGLGQLDSMYGNVDLAYTELIANLGARQAATWQNIEYEPSDMYQGPGLQWAMDAYDTELERQVREDERLEKEAELDFGDVVEGIVSLAGSGALEWFLP